MESRKAHLQSKTDHAFNPSARGWGADPSEGLKVVTIRIAAITGVPELPALPSLGRHHR